MIALVPVRDGVLPAGAEEVVAECGGRAVLVGAGAARRRQGPGRAGQRRCRCGRRRATGRRRGPPRSPRRWTREPVIVLPASADGRDLAPRLAHRLGRPLLAGAIEVSA